MPESDKRPPIKKTETKPRKEGKPNPKGQKAIEVLKTCEREILGARGFPRLVTDSLKPDWKSDRLFRLQIWTREILRLSKTRSDVNADLACSALLQGYLELENVRVPSGVFRDNFYSAGRGRRPSLKAAELLHERDAGKTHGQIGAKHFPKLSSRDAYTKVRDTIKSAQARVKRKNPFDGELFDQLGRMFGAKTREEEIEDDIKKAELGQYYAVGDEEDEFDSISPEEE